MSIKIRVADHQEDYRAVFRGAMAFVRSMQAKDIMPVPGSPDFDKALKTILALPGVSVLLAEDDSGEVVGMLGSLVTPFIWDRSRLCCEELFWWVSPGAPNSAALKLMRQHRDDAKMAGAEVMIFHKLDESPDGVDRVYRKMGTRPVQTTYMGTL